MNAKLVILQGESTGSEFHLFKDRTVIGRAEQSDIVIIDPGSSRQHLEIARSSTCYILTDLNSGNGTQLNGYKILKAELVNGDLIRVGSHEMRFVQHAGSSLDPHQRKIEYAPGAAQAAPYQAAPSTPGLQGTGLNEGSVRLKQGSVDSTRAVINPEEYLRKSHKKKEKQSSLGLAITIIFALVALGLITVIGYYGYSTLFGDNTAEINAQRATLLVSEGDEALVGGHFETASNRFTAALSLVPNNIAAENGLERSITEARMFDLLSEANQRVENRNYSRAVITLRDVMRDSTLFHDQAAEQLNSLVAHLLDQGQDALARGDLSEAEHLTTIAIQAAPENRSVNALKDAITQFRLELTSLPSEPIPPIPTPVEISPAEIDADPSPRPTSAANRSGSARVRQPETAVDNSQRMALIDDAVAELVDSEEELVPVQQVEAAVAAPSVQPDPLILPDPPVQPDPPIQAAAVSTDRAWEDYIQGEFADASQRFRDAGDETTADQVDSFKESYETGSELFESGDYDLAVRPLNRARSLDRRLNSHYQSNLRGKLAESYFQMGLAAYNAEEYRTSGRHLRNALQYNSDHNEARRQVRRLEEGPAQNLFIEANAVKISNPERAQQLCRDIIQMLPEDNALRSRAEELLDTL